MIERYIDYLQVSTNYPQSVCREKMYKLIPPVAFYKIGYQDENEVRYYYGNPNTKKALCILSGRALNQLRGNNQEDSAILEIYLSQNGTVSRIDLAVTEWIEDALCTLAEIEAWYTEGKIKSPLVEGGCKSIVDIPFQAERATQTVYIGDMEKRAQKGIFRAYDKGVEMDLGQFIVTRLELEDRGDKAMATAKRIAQTGDIAGNFRARFDVNDPEFERLMQSPVADITRGSNMQKRDEIEARNKRWEWLIKQVAPSIKQAIKDDARLEMDDARLNEFLARSGLDEIMRNHAMAIALRAYYSTLEDNGLL